MYLISGGQKHYIQTPATVRALEVNQAKAVPDSTLDAIPTGLELPPLTTQVIQKASTGEVFLLQAGKRHYIPDTETLKALGLAGQVQALKDNFADAIPVGSPVEHRSATPAK